MLCSVQHNITGSFMPHLPYISYSYFIWIRGFSYIRDEETGFRFYKCKVKNKCHYLCASKWWIHIWCKVSRVLRVRYCTSLPGFPFTAEWRLLISVLCISNNYPHTLLTTNTTGVHPLMFQMFIFQNSLPLFFQILFTITWKNNNKCFWFIVNCNSFPL